MDEKQSIVRQILKNEFSWILFIGAGLWGFVATVVMPIQALQLGQAKIQEKLDFESTKYGQFETRLGVVEKDTAVIMKQLEIR